MTDVTYAYGMSRCHGGSKTGFGWRLNLRDFTLKSGRVLSVPETLKEKLEGIHSIDELYGFANRRKVLGCVDDSIAPKWTDEERQLIVLRKCELEKAI